MNKYYHVAIPASKKFWCSNIRMHSKINKRPQKLYFLSSLVLTSQIVLYLYFSIQQSSISNEHPHGNNRSFAFYPPLPLLSLDSLSTLNPSLSTKSSPHWAESSELWECVEALEVCRGRMCQHPGPHCWEAAVNFNYTKFSTKKRIQHEAPNTTICFRCAALIQLSHYDF